jgi:hypothetical protein
LVKLDRVVPFGRSLAEYQLMFGLTLEDLNRKCLDLAAGPASFNAEMGQLGYRVISVDPIYELIPEVIQQRFDQCVDNIIDQIHQTPQDWVWGYHKSAQDLRQNREWCLQKFLADYDRGKAQGRYRVGALPDVWMAEKFDLVLCSHFLFLYSDQFNAQFHLRSILQMLNLAPEVRIFPLLTLDLRRSPHLDPTRAELEKRGYASEIVKVDYELQRGGNEMLKIGRA